jgi:hypothetical protein
LFHPVPAFASPGVNPVLATTTPNSLPAVDAAGFGYFGDDLSTTGRYLSFLATDADLDTTGVTGVAGQGPFGYVKDLATGKTLMVTVNSADQPANGSTDNLRLSADGQHVTFASVATNLVPGLNDGQYHVYWRDLATGVTKGLPATGQYMGISGNGEYVAYDLTDVGASGIGLWDTQTDTTQVLPITGGGAQLSADGLHITYTPDGEQVYMYDVLTGITTLVSATAADVGGNGESFAAYDAVSANGRFVAFSSDATDLVPGTVSSCPPANCGHIYLRDITAGTTTLVDSNTDGSVAGGGEEQQVVSMTADASSVGFASTEKFSGVGPPTGVAQAYVRNLTANTITRVSSDANGNPATSTTTDGQAVALSGDGTTSAFGSAASFGGDNPSGNPEIFVVHLGQAASSTPTTTSLAVSQSGVAGTDVSLSATVDGPGAIPNTAGTVSFYDNGSASPLNGAPVTSGSGTYPFDIPAGLPAGSHSIVAMFTPTDPASFQASQSAPSPFFLSGPLAGPCASPGSVCTDTQTVQTQVPVGTLIINTPYTPANPLDLGPMTLNSNGTEFNVSGGFRCITVADTTAGSLPWTAQVLASNLVDQNPPAGATVTAINAENVGLTGMTRPVAPADAPTCSDAQSYTGVVATADNPAAEPPVALADAGSQGLGGTSSHTLAQGSGGDGAATLDGTLTINAPTNSAAGTYTGTITFTVAD